MNEILAAAVERMKMHGYSEEVIWQAAQYLRDNWEHLTQTKEVEHNGIR